MIKPNIPRKCVYLRFKIGVKGHNVLDIKNIETFITKNVVFYENIFPYKILNDNHNLNSETIQNNFELLLELFHVVIVLSGPYNHIKDIGEDNVTPTVEAINHDNDEGRSERNIGQNHLEDDHNTFKRSSRIKKIINIYEGLSSSCQQIYFYLK